MARVPRVNRTPVSRLVGAALLIPALLVWLLALVAPTMQLVLMSLQKHRPFGDTKPEFIGLDNYGSAVEDGVIGSLFYGVSLAVLPLLVFFLTGPLLGWAASHATAWVRRPARVLLMLPLAAFVPVVAGYAWFMRGWPRDLPDPDEISTHERLALVAGAFGLICALSFTVYSSVFRPTGRPRWLAALAISGIALLAATAIGIQQFGIEQVVSFRDESQTMETLMFGFGFRELNLGPAAAVGSIEFLVLAILGLLAAALVLLTGLRIRVLPRSAESRPANPGAAVGLGAGVLLIVGIAALFLLPWLGGLDNSPDRQLQTDFAGSWIAPFLTTSFAVGLAVIGGFGIGALRPLGKYSEVLLLPFAPWLFTGTGLFVLRAFAGAADNGTVGTFWALLPPLWIFVPALFVFTLIFRGQATQAEPGSLLKTYVLPVLPAVVIAIVVFWLLQAQDLLWSMVMSKPDAMSAPMAFIFSAGGSYRSSLDDIAYAVVTPLWLIPIVVIGAMLSQWFYADRVVITTGD